MKKQEYLVLKWVRKEAKETGWEPDYKRFYKTYREAWENLRKNDIMLVCKAGSIKKMYYREYGYFEYEVDENDIIRRVER